MKTSKITDFIELHNALQPYTKHKNYYFRGQSSTKWDLRPKVGREPFKNVNDKDILESWKRAAVQYITNQPTNDWEWLAIAQHHGFPTRLLDWTRNPLVATYFACAENVNEDGIVYIIKTEKVVKTEVDNPFTFDGIKIFHPKIVVPRLSNQQGLFTCHGKPKLLINDKSEGIMELHKIIIQSDYKHQLIKDLNSYGINCFRLFPDLDGLSKYMCWTIESKEYWTL